MTHFRGGDSEDVQKEFLDVVRAKEVKKQHSHKSFLATATSGEFWRPFSCVGVLYIFFRLSCFGILSHYTAPFLERAEIILDPLVASILIGIFRLFASLCSFIILSITSKRTAFFLCGGLSTVAMLGGKLQNEINYYFNISVTFLQLLYIPISSKYSVLLQHGKQSLPGYRFLVSSLLHYVIQFSWA